MNSIDSWTRVDGLGDIETPGLLVDADAVARNIVKMIQLVDGRADRLRPHVKTHKMREIVRLQIEAGIKHFKVATLAEADMVASCDAGSVLLAYPLVGPNLTTFADLIRRYPDVQLIGLVDSQGGVDAFASLEPIGRPIQLMIDVDCGMHRTGIPFGEGLDQLRERIDSTAELSFAGLHVYDGHLHQPELDQRQAATSEIIDCLRGLDASVPEIVAGGSPTFPIWAQTPWQCSPGTPLLWDRGYGQSYPDLEFEIAAALLTRVISKPGGNRLCLDLGYKAVASEMPLTDRVHLPTFPDADFIGHSEEHLVIASDRANQIQIGETLLAFPKHICPTVALHGFVTVVRDYHATKETWQVAARHRQISS